MASKRELKYAQALDALDARKASGQVGANEYELQRTRLVKEAGKQRWHWGFQIALILGILLVALIVLRIAGTFINAANGY